MSSIGPNRVWVWKQLNCTFGVEIPLSVSQGQRGVVLIEMRQMWFPKPHQAPAVLQLCVCMSMRILELGRAWTRRSAHRWHRARG